MTASVYKEVLVEHGLPADFLDQLAAATSALKSSIDARGMALSKRTGATASVAGDHDLGRRIVSMIDASLTHVLKNDPVTFASWRQAKRYASACVPPTTSHWSGWLWRCSRPSAASVVCPDPGRGWPNTSQLKH